MSKLVPKFIPLTSIDSADISSSYQPINSDGLPQPCLNITINNSSNQDAIFSLDGVTAHFVVQKTTSFVYFSNAYSATTPDTVKFSRGTVFYVKGTAGTGLIYLSGTYLEQ